MRIPPKVNDLVWVYDPPTGAEVGPPFVQRRVSGMRDMGFVKRLQKRRIIILFHQSPLRPYSLNQDEMEDVWDDLSECAKHTMAKLVIKKSLTKDKVVAAKLQKAIDTIANCPPLEM